MFKSRYLPKENGDKVSIRDNRLRGSLGFFAVIGIIFCVVFYFLGLNDGDGQQYAGLAVGLIIFAPIYLLLRCCECKYVITAEYIAFRYGIFGHKIRFENVKQCFYNSSAYITLIEESGRESTIDLIHMEGEYDDYFLNAIRNGAIKIRTIGIFEDSEEKSDCNYNFKMRQKNSAGSVVFFVICMIAIDALIWAIGSDSVLDTETILILLGLVLGNTLLWVFIILKVSAYFHVHDHYVEYKAPFKKPKVLDVNDISWVHTEIVHRSSRQGGDIEQMFIYVDKKPLKWNVDITRHYANYDLFGAFLHDNGVPFSLEKEELITYSKVKSDSEKTTHELLNLEEHAFTVDENNVIENGIFAGKQFHEECDEDVDYTPFIKKYSPLHTISSLLVGMASFVFLVTIILARVDILSGVAALLIPGDVFVLGLILSTLCDTLLVRDMLKEAKPYKATVFMADVLAEEKLVVYAYEDRGGVYVIEAMNFDSKRSQEDWNAMYGEPVYIWADLSKIGYCLEGDETAAKKEGKKGLKIALLSVLFAILTAGAIIFQSVYEANKPMIDTSEVESNENYEAVLIQYDDNGTYVDEHKMDVTTTGYKWGANLTSLYAYMEEGNPNVIGGHSVDGWVYDETVEMLDKAYGILDRDSAKEVLDRMITYGHQAKYRLALDDKNVKKAISAIQKDFPDGISYDDSMCIDESYFKNNGISTDHFYAVKGVACAYVRFGENAFMGYDYIRLTRVAFLAYQCGYITEEECSELLYNMETQLQEEYSSYRDIHECYSYGEMFRLSEMDDDSRETINDIYYAINRLDTNGYYTKIEKEFNNDIKM